MHRLRFAPILPFVLVACLGGDPGLEHASTNLWSDWTIDRLLPTLEIRGALDRSVTAPFARRHAGYTLPGRAGQRLVLDLTAPGLDSMMWVFGPRTGETWSSAPRVAYADDWNGTSDAHVAVTLPQEGEYLVVVRELRLRPGQFTLASPCMPAPPDTTPPSVTGVRMRAVADVTSAPAVVSFAFDAEDAESGVWGGVSFNVLAPSGRSALSGYAVRQQDGVYRADLTLPLGAEPGEYTMYYVTLTDNAGNWRTYYGPEVTALGVVPVVVTNAGAVDIEAPVVVDIGVPAEPVDVTESGRSVELDVLADDDLSGISSMSLAFVSPSGRWHSAQIDLSTLHARVEIPAGSEAGRYTLNYVYVSDGLGNVAYGYNGDPTGAGLDIREVSFEVQNLGPADVRGPVVTDVRFSPSEVRLIDSAVLLTIEVDADDDRSGIAGGIVIGLTSASGLTSLWAYATQAQDDALEPIAGLYRATVSVPFGTEPGRLAVTNMNASDNAGNYGWADPSNPTALGIDITTLGVEVVEACGL